MGNTKTYYVEGELKPGVTLEQFKEEAGRWFRYTYCVAEIVETRGGYLGVSGRKDETTAQSRGPYLVAAIHSYSLGGDSGPGGVAGLFVDFKAHRMDWDCMDGRWWEKGRGEDKCDFGELK